MVGSIVSNSANCIANCWVGTRVEIRIPIESAVVT